MRTRIYHIVITTITEGPGVYLWLQLQEQHFWWALLALVAGELLETTLVAVLLRREARPGPADAAAADAAHARKVGLLIGGASVAEIGIWLLWLELVEPWSQLGAGAALLVLMHVKHHVEVVAVRDIPFKSRLFAPSGLFASAMEVGGAVGCLALLKADEPVWAGVALAAGLLIEHAMLVDVLQWEIEARDISRPRDPRWRPPTRLRGIAIYAGTHFPRLWRRVNAIGPLQRLANRAAINGLIAQIEPRPNPLSTLESYTSWQSLTDKTWSGRHLPPVPPESLSPATTLGGPPTCDTVAKLFKRRGPMTPCPKSTVLFPCFAQWFTDGILRTTRDIAPDGSRDTRKNESNHEIDLAQLYGLKDEVTWQLRTRSGGLLKSQPIGDEEYPPHYAHPDGTPKREFSKLPKPLGFDGVPDDVKPKLFAMGSDTRNLGFMAFNVLFLREHNRIAKLLAVKHPEWRDDDERLFGTARMILTVVLLKVVIEDYINHINPSHLPFRLTPGAFPNEPWHRPNWLAIEFNLLYRWHSLVPGEYELQDGRLSIKESLSNPDPLTSGGLGAFMEAASEQPAGRMSLFNTHKFLVQNAERPSIQQARVARLASYNDYRRLSCMTPMHSFAQISSDPKVQHGLATVYETVEDIEFYVGLFAEECGPDDVLPPLMLTMVAYDAFSQALTNPLLAPRVYNEQTFSATGMEIIKRTGRIADIVNRNVGVEPGPFFVSLTRRDYRHS